MKYQVGDLVLVREFEWKSRPHLHPRPRLLNTLGIILTVEKHSDIFNNGSTENDNGYIWYSQVDAVEYHFYESEVVGEVIK